MKRTSYFVVIIFTLFFLTACQSSEVSNYSIVKIKDVYLNVEVVSSFSQTAKGLSGREILCNDCGMLFEFSDYKIRNFWMKEMQFPLDIIWIKDNQIIGIEKNVPVYTNEEITRARSPEPVNYVLEVNTGWTESNSIRIGDMIDKL